MFQSILASFLISALLTSTVAASPELTRTALRPMTEGAEPALTAGLEENPKVDQAARAILKVVADDITLTPEGTPKKTNSRIHLVDRQITLSLEASRAFSNRALPTPNYVRQYGGGEIYTKTSALLQKATASAPPPKREKTACELWNSAEAQKLRQLGITSLKIERRRRNTPKVFLDESDAEYWSFNAIARRAEQLDRSIQANGSAMKISRADMTTLLLDYHREVLQRHGQGSFDDFFKLACRVFAESNDIRELWLTVFPVLQEAHSLSPREAYDLFERERRALLLSATGLEEQEPRHSRRTPYAKELARRLKNHVLQSGYSAESPLTSWEAFIHYLDEQGHGSELEWANHAALVKEGRAKSENGPEPLAYSTLLRVFLEEGWLRVPVRERSHLYREASTLDTARNLYPYYKTNHPPGNSVDDFRLWYLENREELAQFNWELHHPGVARGPNSYLAPSTVALALIKLGYLSKEHVESWAKHRAPFMNYALLNEAELSRRLMETLQGVNRTEYGYFPLETLRRQILLPIFPGEDVINRPKDLGIFLTELLHLPYAQEIIAQWRADQLPVSPSPTAGLEEYKQGWEQRMGKTARQMQHHGWLVWARPFSDAFIAARRQAETQWAQAGSSTDKVWQERFRFLEDVQLFFQALSDPRNNSVLVQEIRQGRDSYEARLQWAAEEKLLRIILTMHFRNEFPQVSVKFFRYPTPQEKTFQPYGEFRMGRDVDQKIERPAIHLDVTRNGQRSWWAHHDLRAAWLPHRGLSEPETIDSIAIKNFRRFQNHLLRRLERLSPEKTVFLSPEAFLRAHPDQSDRLALSFDTAGLLVAQLPTEIWIYWQENLGGLLDAMQPAEKILKEQGVTLVYQRFRQSRISSQNKPGIILWDGRLGPRPRFKTNLPVYIHTPGKTIPADFPYRLIQAALSQQIDLLEVEPIDQWTFEKEGRQYLVLAVNG